MESDAETRKESMCVRFCIDIIGRYENVREYFEDDECEEGERENLWMFKLNRIESTIGDVMRLRISY